MSEFEQLAKELAEAWSQFREERDRLLRYQHDAWQLLLAAPQDMQVTVQLDECEARLAATSAHLKAVERMRAQQPPRAWLHGLSQAERWGVVEVVPRALQAQQEELEREHESLDELGHTVRMKLRDRSEALRTALDLGQKRVSELRKVWLVPFAELDARHTALRTAEAWEQACTQHSDRCLAELGVQCDLQPPNTSSALSSSSPQLSAQRLSQRVLDRLAWLDRCLVSTSLLPQQSRAEDNQTVRLLGQGEALRGAWLKFAQADRARSEALRELGRARTPFGAYGAEARAVWAARRAEREAVRAYFSEQRTAGPAVHMVNDLVGIMIDYL